ncbi:PaaI family thioesterase [Thalassovita sp.]|uniref:PaaI family thioesterase n=1 Tax=Thalassovita sp. TaxID=1979401 RepID=UPI0029DE83FB|nr:PaaI family thioesterase [Thalassovita sp.]
MAVKMSAQELTEFAEEVFPQVKGDFIVEEVRDMAVRLRMPVAEKHLRPGGTVSGPSMFALADCAVYFAVLAMIGPKALAVTTNCSLDFMRKPEAGRDLIAECRLLKLGKLLAVGDVLIYSDGREAPVARSTMTYAIPPE